jgi:small subunit ribosomal protein S21
MNRNYKHTRKERPPRDEGLTVTVRDGNLEKAMRIFKKKVQKAGILKDAKEKRFFEKPSEKKQRKKKEAVRRWRKLQKKLELLD